MKIGIIGAGIGGLASACRLAQAGHDVTVFEKNPAPGGKAGEWRRDGFRFDTGPTVLTLPFVLQELFQYCNAELSDYLTLVPLTVSCRYFYTDKTKINAYHERESFFRESVSKTSITRKELERYFSYVKEIYDLAAPLFLFENFRSRKIFSHPLAKKIARQFLKLDPFRTMHQANSKLLKDHKLIQLFDRFATYNGSDPYQTPATLNIIAHVEQTLGTYTLEGGIYQLPLALMRLADKLGVQFYFNSPVEKILYDNNRKISGITLVNGACHSFPVLLSNVDIIPTYSKLLGLSRSKTQKRYEKMGLSSSGVLFYWGIKEAHPQLESNNIFFSADYRKEFVEIFREKNCQSAPTFYIHISNRTNTEDAPLGAENWFVMINGPHENGQNWEWEIPRLRDLVLSTLKSHGINLDQKILFEKVCTPLDLEKQTGSHRGSLYGVSSNTRLAAFLRHPNRVKKYPGLYVAGGSVHPGGGIPLALLSARHAVEALLEDYPDADCR